MTVKDIEEKLNLKFYSGEGIAEKTAKGCYIGDLLSLAMSKVQADYVWITIHDELPPPDAKVTLSVNFPNMMKFSVVNSRTKYDVDVQALRQMEDKTVEELFCDFYRLQNNDQLPGEKHLAVLHRVIGELEEKLP